jgi:tetratricopeptide (TPR) repeat protein
MAKKRSKKRRKTGRTSFPPSMRPSEAPSSVAPPSDANPSSDAKPSERESDRAPKSTDKAKPKKSSARGSFFDIPPDDHVEASPDAASATEDEAPSKPAKEAKDEPRDLKEEEPRSDPGKDDAPDSEPGASPKQAAKSKDERQDGPDQDEGEEDSGDEAAHDDGLHDDFFRKGEEVEKEHIAAREQVVNGAPKLEDTGQRRLVALRTAPALVARRKKLRKIVAYVLAPAVVISVIAGFKAYNGDNGAGRQDQPVARVTVQPSAAPSPPPPVASVAPVVAPAASSEELISDASADSDGVAPDGEAEVVADAAPELQDAVAEADAENDAAEKVEVAAETEAADDVPEGVDARKEALAALNRAKWDRAEKMARAALAKSPEDATLYLYQATALQEMGRREDAKAVFKRCVDNAKRGPINECRMFAR